MFGRLKLFKNISCCILSLFNSLKTLIFYLSLFSVYNKKVTLSRDLSLLTNPSKKNYASATAFTSLILALIFASISLAKSGLSRKRDLTESRPCPSLLLS